MQVGSIGENEFDKLGFSVWSNGVGKGLFHTHREK